MTKFKVLALGLFLVSTTACGPTIMGERMSKSLVCRAADTSKCAQGTGNIAPVVVDKNNQFLVITDDQPEYWQYLGRYWEKGARPTNTFCGNTIATNPFLEAAETLGIEPVQVTNAIAFDFERSVQKQLSLAASVDVDAVLSAASIPTESDRLEAEAAIQAALARLEKSEMQLVGTYYYYALHPDLLAAFKAGDMPASLQQCRETLEGHDGRAVTSSITGVQIKTLTTAGSLVSDASSSLSASLKDKLEDIQIASLTAEFEKAVSEKYSSDTAPTYQILTVGGYELRPR